MTIFGSFTESRDPNLHTENQHPRLSRSPRKVTMEREVRKKRK